MLGIRELGVKGFKWKGFRTYEGMRHFWIRVLRELGIEDLWIRVLCL